MEEIGSVTVYLLQGMHLILESRDIFDSHNQACIIGNFGSQILGSYDHRQIQGPKDGTQQD